MYKNILQSIDNIAIWPLISLGIFFSFFVLLLWWVFTVDKAYIKEMENMPLTDSKDSGANTTSSNQNL